MKYFYYRNREHRFFAYRNVLNEVHWFKTKGNNALVPCEQPCNIYDAHELQVGYVPKLVRSRAFMDLHGTAWLEDLVKKNHLIISVDKTIEIATFILGRPITSAYSLPDVIHDSGRVEYRWKANGEMLQQYRHLDNSLGEVFCEKLSYERDKLTRGEFCVCRDFSPGETYYGSELDGEMLWWCVQDSGNQRTVTGCEMPLGLFVPISAFEVPISVRALRFTEEHGDSWLKAIRESGKMSDLTDGQLIIQAYVRGKPIWPWDVE